MAEGQGLAEYREAFAVASGALARLGGELWRVGSDDLEVLMAEVDRLAALTAAARVVITAEALVRGVVAESGANAHAWVREHAPSLRQGGAGHVAEIATLASGGGAPWSTAGGGVDPASPVGMVLAGVAHGAVSPALAVATVREITRLDPVLRDEAQPTVAAKLLELGTAWGPSLMRRLRPRLVAEFGRQGEFDDLQARLAPGASLSMPTVESGDLTDYRLVLTPEQAAALEAAIGPLSAPAPNEESGERDHRPAGQRRAEALAEVCRRSSAFDAGASGADGAGAAAAAVHVTISLAELEARAGCGEVLASSATGALLSPEVVRRVCCEADLVPHVLGTAGEDLDLGRVARLFTRAQRRALRRRDRGCTYPGCTAPAAWTRAHHVVHWADGGPSDLDNAALLCQRHHTFVHDRRLMAEVRRRPDERGRYVVWDVASGSYDRHLDRRAAERAANDPPPLTPQRWSALVASVAAADDRDERRWAEHELHRASASLEELLDDTLDRPARPFAIASRGWPTGAGGWPGDP